MRPGYGPGTSSGRGGEGGGSLLTAVIILLVLSVLGFTVAGIAAVGARGGQKTLESRMAFQAAEAGRQYALWAYEAGYEFLPGVESGEHAVGSGTFTLEYSDEEGIRRFISRGYVPAREDYRAKRALLAVFLLGPALSDIFSYGTMFLRGNAEILGYCWETGEYITDYSVGSNEEFVFRGNYNVSADEQEDEQDQTRDPVEIPAELEGMDYTGPGDPGLWGDYTVSEGADGRTDFHPGDKNTHKAFMGDGDFRFAEVSMASDSELIIDGHARLYVTGGFEMSGQSKLLLTEGSTLEIYLGEGVRMKLSGTASLNPDGAPSDVRIYAAADTSIDLVGNAISPEIRAVIYAPESDIKIVGRAELWGSVIADSLDMGGNARLVYVSEGDGEEEEARIVAEYWSELSR